MFIRTSFVAATAAATSSQLREHAMYYAQRNPAFATITPDHLTYFNSVLQTPCKTTYRTGKLLTESAQIAQYNVDWLQTIEGACPAVLLPTCTEHVQAIVSYCHTHHIAIVPQGGNTGLVYGSVPLHDEVVLSTQLMNMEPVVSEETMTLQAEAGVILERALEASKRHDLLFPLTMGSKGSAMLGGCVSTNAGGIHYARYNGMHTNVLGLEAVDGQGRVYNLMSSLRKDNAGYDLKHLFIGSEGTLGIVTKCIVKLYQYPNSQNIILFQVRSFPDVQLLYELANKHLGECLSAFEVIDNESFICTPESNMPFAKMRKVDAYISGEDYTAGYFGVLIEINGSEEQHNFAKILSFADTAEDKLRKTDSMLSEPILAENASHNARLWKLREEVPVYSAHVGMIFKYDISFPLNKFYNIVEHVREILYGKYKLDPEEVLVIGYGHFGDGNIHLNVIDRVNKHYSILRKALGESVYQFCAEHHGSISAEHGVGVQKRDYLHLSRSPEAITLMRELKTQMDPHGILNPYKVLPAPQKEEEERKK